MADDCGDGLTLVPAVDETGNLGRHIPLQASGVNARSAAALLARRGFTGRSGGFLGKGMGSISAGPLPDLLSILSPIVSGSTAAAVVWLRGRAGRKVRLKIGDTEAEARTVDELKELMKLADEMSKKRPKKGSN